jgi:glycosyltransferase involved in cell wall biosynthesis
MGERIMDLSIIIPSFQRADLLDMGLQSLAQQTITSQYEVLVLNEGIEDRTKIICKQYEKYLPMKYVFTGQRNANGIRWRIPAFAINIGVQLSQGKNIILTCPEIYVINDCVQRMIDLMNEDPKRIVITEGKDDRGAIFLGYVKSNYDNNTLNRMYDHGVKNFHDLNTEYPFFMGINRDEFVSIGGYDEEFGDGYCWDDLDIVTRLKKNGCYYHKINSKIVHLYHPRLRYGNDDIKEGWKKNEALFYSKINQIKRNEGRPWGVYGV